jgi:hypothetical protein
MPNGRDGEAVLLTGVFGSGKTSVAEEIADVLEKRGVAYAALDLDWLVWFQTGTEDESAEHRMLLTNLTAVIGNYLAVGVRFFILAGAVRNKTELDGIRAVLPVPMKVVRLTVPLREISGRLRSAVTAGRHDDLRAAAAALAASEGEGIEDVTMANDRSIREVAHDILGWLEWIPTPENDPTPTGRGDEGGSDGTRDEAGWRR